MKQRDRHFDEEWVRCPFCQGAGVRVNEKGQPLVANEKRIPCVFCADAGHPGIILVKRLLKYSEPLDVIGPAPKEEPPEGK